MTSSETGKPRTVKKSPPVSRQPKKKAATRAYPTPALEKGLDILELLAEEPAGLTKSEVARRLGRTVSEIFRMLLCLEERGYIAQRPDDERYWLTLRLFQLAQQHPPLRRIINKALPILQAAVPQIRQSCHLAVLENGQVVILIQVDSPASLGFHVRSGSTADLMRTASGYVLLAHLPPEQKSAAIAAWQAQTGGRAPSHLEQHLAKIRKAGFEQRDSYIIKGVVNVSFPVFDHRGHAVAALTVPYIQHLGETPSLEQVREILRAASMQLTQAIGGTNDAL